MATSQRVSGWALLAILILILCQGGVSARYTGPVGPALAGSPQVYAKMGAPDWPSSCKTAAEPGLSVTDVAQAGPELCCLPAGTADAAWRLLQPLRQAQTQLYAVWHRLQVTCGALH